MADVVQVVLLHDRRGWRVRVVPAEGPVRCYRYRSEAQARYFAAVFALGPRVLPPCPRTRAPRRRAPAAVPPQGGPG